jgi:hypothetical protein
VLNTPWEYEFDSKAALIPTKRLAKVEMATLEELVFFMFIQAPKEPKFTV